MGVRGPLRLPTSIRGQKEERLARRKPLAYPATATPRKPEWLPDAAKPSWKGVIRDLNAASVPLQRIDGQAIGMYVLTILEVQKATDAGDTKLAARLGRDALQWAAAIGATPASRARLGIKPSKPEVLDDDVWNSL